MRNFKPTFSAADLKAAREVKNRLQKEMLRRVNELDQFTKRHPGVHERDHELLRLRRAWERADVQFRLALHRVDLILAFNRNDKGIV